MVRARERWFAGGDVYGGDARGRTHRGGRSGEDRAGGAGFAERAVRVEFGIGGDGDDGAAGSISRSARVSSRGEGRESGARS